MAEKDLTVYKKPEITLDVIDGDPPVDQSAEVAALQGQVATLTQQLEAATQQGNAWKAQVEAARIPAQQTVDALA